MTTDILAPNAQLTESPQTDLHDDRNGSREDGSSRASSSSARSLDLPSLQPLSHQHPLLSAAEFDPDVFLLSRLHIPMDELRAELRGYLGVLREELVQLINDDYEEFISLGTGLRGEAGRLKQLQRPLGGLCQETIVVRKALAQHQEVVESKLGQRSELREQKAILDLLNRLFDTLHRAEMVVRNEEPDHLKKLSRIASEYSQLAYLVEKARTEDCMISTEVETRLETIRSRLESDLADVLLITVREISETRLRQCLRIYDAMQGWTKAAEAFRSAFSKSCQEATATTAQTPRVPETPTAAKNPFEKTRLSGDSSLVVMFNGIISLSESFQSLIEVAAEISEEFSFFEVMMEEISSAILKLGPLFVAGRPEELHSNYTATRQLFSILEQIAPSTDSITRSRSSDACQQLQQRWQLPVYFQLRWKEIVGQLVQSSGDSKGWALPLSASTFRALESCYAKDIFIPELAARFQRLSLQIIVRYSSQLSQSLGEMPVEDDHAAEEAALQHACASLLDIKHLTERVKAVEELPSLVEGELDPEPFRHRIVSITSRRCCEPLKLVRSVASQFRTAPTKVDNNPSYFVPTVLKPLSQLLESQSRMKAEYGIEWSTQVVDEVLSAYASILASVRKTEDLLRRHRKSKKTTFSLFGSSSVADVEAEEERFKNQMLTDVEAVGKSARALGVEVSKLGSWRELLEVCNRPSE